MIYIVTAVHNRYKITEHFVDTLLKQSFTDFRLLIVDDGCTDGTSEMVKRKMPDAIILHGDGKLFWGGALNEAYKWLVKNANDKDFVMFGNDDTKFGNDYLEKAYELLKYKQDCLITGKGYDINTGVQIDGAIDNDLVSGTRTLLTNFENYGNCASTRSLFFSVEALKKIGGFHPIMLPHYGSDYEWTMRAVRKGFKIYDTEQLKYEFDPGTTGYNDIKKLTLKKLFSKRSMSNPFYKINFIILSTPVICLPLCLCKQILNYIKKLGVFISIVKRKGEN